LKIFVRCILGSAFKFDHGDRADHYKPASNILEKTSCLNFDFAATEVQSIHQQEKLSEHKRATPT